MGIDAMGRVVTSATIENLSDMHGVQLGVMNEDDVRRITVENALVDPGATLLSLPTHIIKQLGLKKVVKKLARTANGMAEAWLYGSVRLTVQDRFCTIDVLEVPDDVPPLIGQIPLEQLDFVIDVREQRLIGNPRHGGDHMFELY